MSLHFNCVRVDLVPKLGTIPEHWEVSLGVASSVRKGEHRDAVCQRVFDRVYGDIREDFDAFMALAFPNGDPDGDAGKLCRFIRLKLRGECSEPDMRECSHLHLIRKGQIQPPVLSD